MFFRARGRSLSSEASFISWLQARKSQCLTVNLVDFEIAATWLLSYAAVFCMSVTPAKIQALLETELSALTDQRVISHVRSLLVEPTAVMRDWAYGRLGERYPCWAVLNHNDSNTGIAYCESGFGPKCPWGLVFLSGTQHMFIGMDSAWYERFLDA